jgi:hypothetical protein
MTGNRHLRAWPASDGLVVGEGLGVNAGVADRLAEASGVVLALGAIPQAQAATANATIGSKNLFMSISTGCVQVRLLARSKNGVTASLTANAADSAEFW